MKEEQQEEQQNDVNIEYTLPPNGVQTLFQILLFISNLITKCLNPTTPHFISLLHHILTLSNNFYHIPLTSTQLLKQFQQFISNSAASKQYQLIFQQIQNCYYQMFEFNFQNDIQSIQVKEIWYYYITKKIGLGIGGQQQIQEGRQIKNKKIINKRIYNLKILTQIVYKQIEIQQQKNQGQQQEQEYVSYNKLSCKLYNKYQLYKRYEQGYYKKIYININRNINNNNINNFKQINEILQIQNNQNIFIEPLSSNTSQSFIIFVQPSSLKQYNKTQIQQYTNTIYQFCTKSYQYQSQSISQSQISSEIKSNQNPMMQVQNYLEQSHKVNIIRSRIDIYLQPIVQQLIKQQNSIQKKNIILKLIDNLIQQQLKQKYKQKQKYNRIKSISNILKKNKLLERFLTTRTHSQLLKRILPVLKFQYQYNHLPIQKILCYLQAGYSAHQQYQKIILQLIKQINLNYLQQIFNYIKKGNKQYIKQIRQKINQGKQNNNINNNNINDGINQNQNYINFGLSQNYKRQRELLLTNGYTVSVMNSLVSNVNVVNIKQKENGMKEDKHNNISNNKHNNNNNSKMQIQQKNPKQSLQQSSHQSQSDQQQYNQFLPESLFKYLFTLIQSPLYQNLYLPILCKHISNHIHLLLPLLQKQFLNKLTKPKYYQTYVISLLEYCLKLQIKKQTKKVKGNRGKGKGKDVVIQLKNKKKINQDDNQRNIQQPNLKYQFINNLVLNCNFYDSIFVMLCRQRYNKFITEKCLNILTLVTKYYKPLQKSHILLLWKILGLSSSNQYQKQQFFNFIRQILKNNINLTEDSVKYIYFEIILRLNYDWFTIKIYDCFQILFMRLNQDGKLLVYNEEINTYFIQKTQFVGIQKFYYLYYWAQTKVSRKVRDFLHNLYSYKSTAETKQKLSYQIICSIMNYLKRNPQNQDYVLHAKTEDYFNQHTNRAFQFFSKFLDSKIPLNSDQNNQDNKDNLISLNISNAMRQALPPLKKTIYVNKNMILKDFKQLLKKQINPPINKQQIQLQLLSKGKRLKGQKMTLKQLKLQNQNTIIIQSLDNQFYQNKKQLNKNDIKNNQQSKLLECKQTLYSIFSEEHSKQILDFVAQKYFGETLEKICQTIMDQDRMKNLKQDMQLKKQIQGQNDKILLIQKNKQNNLQENSDMQIQKQKILTFGQILSKEIQTLLLVIYQNNQSNIQQKQINKLLNRKWNIIKKIPVNQKIYLEIQYHLIKNPKGLEEIKNIFDDYSINIQAYKWFLIKKILQTKKQQFNDQNSKYCQILKHIILQRLEYLFSNRIYCSQIFNQIFEIYDVIVKRSNLLKQVQVQLTDPLLSIIKFIQQFQKDDIKISIQDSLTPPTCLKAFQFLLSVQVDQFISTKIFYQLIVSVILHSNSNDSYPQIKNIFLLLNIQNQNFIRILSLYKQNFIKFYLIALIHIKTDDSKNQYYCKSYITIFDKIRQGKIQSKDKQSIFYLLIVYVKLIDLFEKSNLIHQFIKDLLFCLQFIQNQYQNLSKNQLSSLMSLIRVLLQKIIIVSQQKDHNKRFQIKNLQTYQQNFKRYVKFLMKDFIFYLKYIPILTEIPLKTQFYLILTKLSWVSYELLNCITKEIVYFGVYRKRNSQNDTIDFRVNDFVGIQNLGCTCYINSLIQQLYHTKLPLELIKMTENRQFNQNNSKYDNNLFQIKRTFMKLFYTVKNIINIYPMIKEVKFYGQQINPRQQQDVQQFLMSLLDYFEQNNAKYIIDDIFGGKFSEQLNYIASNQGLQLQRTKSTYQKFKQEHFYNITLDIKGKKTLNQALIYYFRSQTLDDKIYCQELKQKTLVIKRPFIQRFPKILIFTLKRFQYDVQAGNRHKLNDYLEFPMNLDLTQFSLQKHMRDIKKQNQNSQGLNNPIQIQNNIFFDEKQQKNIQNSYNYILAGIIIHSGSATTGHYYSYIRRNQKWYEFNDRIVTQINLQEKIKNQCFGGGQNKSKNAYILFYQKLNESSINKKKNSKVFTYTQEEEIMQNQIQDKAKLIQDRYHGIFLDQIQPKNYFRQLVQDQNNQFIKQRLIYDVNYRQFVQKLYSTYKQAHKDFSQNYKHSQDSKQTQNQINDTNALFEVNTDLLERINSVINPVYHSNDDYRNKNNFVNRMEDNKMEYFMEEEERKVQDEQQMKKNDEINKLLDL